MNKQCIIMQRKALKQIEHRPRPSWSLCSFSWTQSFQPAPGTDFDSEKKIRRECPWREELSNHTVFLSVLPQPLTSDWYVLALSSDGSFRKGSRLSLKQKQVIFLWCPSIATQRLYSEPLTSTVPGPPRKLVLLGRISLLDKYLAFPFTAV